MADATSLRKYSQDSINKYSLIVMLCVSVATSGLFMVHSYQAHERQTSTWLETFPQNVLPHLIDSDYFSVGSKLKLIKSTELFECFHVYDRIDVKVDGFGEGCSSSPRTPILDAAGESWGTYQYSPSYLSLALPAFVFIVLSLTSVIAIHLAFRRRLTSELDSELRILQDFTQKVYKISESIKQHDLFHSSAEIETEKSASIENRNLEVAFQTLIHEIESREVRIRDLIAQKIQQQAAERLGSITLKVAHDLRSPLMALKVISSSLGEESQFYDLVKAATQRIESIAEDVLLLGKARSVRSEELLKKSLENLIREKEIAHPGLKVNFNFDLTHDYVLTDKNRELERILSNLLQNSIDASERGKPISLLVLENSKKLVFAISDQGKGIPSEILKKVGTPGFSYGKVNGNGLGFSSALEFANSQNGSLKIESEVGRGTSILLDLPKSFFEKSQTA